eukprot:4350148-Lingulodinium_polyedra.AAC.1
MSGVLFQTDVDWVAPLRSNKNDWTGLNSTGLDLFGPICFRVDWIWQDQSNPTLSKDGWP